MTIAVVGLGSMGKRRIRCIKSLGEHRVVGFDPREDRRCEARDRYGIHTTTSIDELFDCGPEAFIISVPPDRHAVYMRIALDAGVPFFVEASVIDEGLEAIGAEAGQKGIVAVPSCTMLFHPGVETVIDRIHSSQFGKISNFSFHSGQYLPDWHTYESVADFYVSNPVTGGGREIVPFELTWLVKAIGMPKRVSGAFGRTIDIPGAAYIDDTYSLVLDYGGFSGTMLVDVSSRFATRRLLVNGTNQQIRWDWEDSEVRVFDGPTQRWERLPYESGVAEQGYNANIGELMYVREIRTFLAAVRGEEQYPTNFSYDARILRLLAAAEESALTGRWVPA